MPLLLKGNVSLLAFIFNQHFLYCQPFCDIFSGYEAPQHYAGRVGAAGCARIVGAELHGRDGTARRGALGPKQAARNGRDVWRARGIRLPRRRARTRRAGARRVFVGEGQPRGQAGGEAGGDARARRVGARAGPRLPDLRAVAHGQQLCRAAAHNQRHPAAVLECRRVAGERVHRACQQAAKAHQRGKKAQRQAHRVVHLGDQRVCGAAAQAHQGRGAGEAGQRNGCAAAGLRCQGKRRFLGRVRVGVAGAPRRRVRGGHSQLRRNDDPVQIQPDHGEPVAQRAVDQPAGGLDARAAGLPDSVLHAVGGGHADVGHCAGAAVAGQKHAALGHGHSGLCPGAPLHELPCRPEPVQPVGQRVVRGHDDHSVDQPGRCARRRRALPCAARAGQGLGRRAVAARGQREAHGAGPRRVHQHCSALRRRDQGGRAAGGGCFAADGHLLHVGQPSAHAAGARRARVAAREPQWGCCAAGAEGAARVGQAAAQQAGLGAAVERGAQGAAAGAPVPRRAAAAARGPFDGRCVRVRGAGALRVHRAAAGAGGALGGVYDVFPGPGVEWARVAVRAAAGDPCDRHQTVDTAAAAQLDVGIAPAPAAARPPASAAQLGAVCGVASIGGLVVA
ncbi:hypothetical protein BX070DRAFT_41964 [Coemansia spiralis]|nr:hypothetical protein BX070DRAFT_41964 [Coemansia spiralis]